MFCMQNACVGRDKIVQTETYSIEEENIISDMQFKPEPGNELILTNNIQGNQSLMREVVNRTNDKNQKSLQ